ncbi:hypothetical protein EJ06DRAFT_416126 [Trichodelitschia bisporula]|uniref:SET domain-containing protein n=1 Tax=Trichodelitschia bisporula TaxID=703511 RepID=A0A6G1HYL1_9PEZI|nr:hypothetical protein EJ06DRAFT_416126 [Trichodelitschia bisporula]
MWNLNGGSFSLSLTESAQRGEEICNNYAPKGNEELLMGYGFCIMDNPCDQVAISLSEPPSQVYEVLKQSFPASFTTPEWNRNEGTFFLRGRGHYTGGYTHDLPCLRGLPPEFFVAILELVRLSFSKRTGEEPPSDQELVCSSIDSVRFRLHQNRNDIAAWIPTLPDGPQNIRQVYSKIYRDGQLRILEEIIEELSEYLDAF